MISSLYLHSRSQAKPLRIGVLVDGFEMIRLFHEVLTDIQSSNFARLELVVINRQDRATAPRPSSNKLARYVGLLLDPSLRRRLLYSIYQKFDRRHVAQPNPLETVDGSGILNKIPRLDVVPFTKKFAHRFPPEAIAALRSYDLDVLLRFGFNILRGEVLTSAKYGVWSFHHGDNDFYRGGPPLFWEVVESNPCSGVILQVLTEKLDDGLVLSKSVFSTNRGLSVTRNLFNPYWGSRHFVIQKLHELHERGWESVKHHVVPPASYQGKAQIYTAPTNGQMVRWLAPQIVRKTIARPFRRDNLVHWRICLRRAPFSRLLNELTPGAAEYRWIESPAGHFYADPFLFGRDRQIWLFFEDYLHENGRGRIVCAPVQPDLSIGPAEPCLEVPYHLSYPFLFSHDGEAYMIPESGSNETVDLYRATDFPLSWKLEKTLFRGRAVDTTPVHHDGRWYFFTTLSETPGNAAFDALFSADDLMGDWELHPDSPISTDVRHARSAGAVQVSGDRLLRPVQDCSDSYGRRIQICEILELSRSAYRERRLHSIEPNWETGLEGVHTYSLCEGIEALDAVSFRPRREIAPARSSRLPFNFWPSHA